MTKIATGSIVKIEFWDETKPVITKDHATLGAWSNVDEERSLVNPPPDAADLYVAAQRKRRRNGDKPVA